MSGRTRSRRFWLIGGALLAAAILLAGWFLVINPKLTSTADLRDQASSAQLQNTAQQAKNNKLKKDNEQVVTLRSGLAAALVQLPSDGGLPAFTRQLSSQATAHGVSLTSMVVGAVAPMSPAAEVPVTGAPVTGVASPTNQAGTPPVVGEATPGLLIQIPINLVVNGPGQGEIAFVKDIQGTGPRRALVTSSQLTPLAGASGAGIDGPCTLTLSLTIFSAPLQPAAAAALATLLSGK